MFESFYEDIVVGETSEFGKREVTKEEIVDFASKFDPQPFHMDEELAKQSVFGNLCASGWHTASMTMRILVDDMKDRRFAGMGSPGLDKLEWKKPVFPGDILRVQSTPLEKRESASKPHLGLVKTETVVVNQNNEVVMRMVSNMMVLKRNPS
ncbi:enoyl-CoA hydratase [Kordiimonas sediminis]|uniref:Enoyl-CoA hydratase n=1 Tax=Kordiimonas sediminis TaxID=1735581 RepID=A0A919AQN5_9PROT|nr:MaoC family dehydratase [Kordiimonas sediminis]GHF18743.1 enoyl-CoA hydratase [Kordiimonas sediminis]